MMAVWLRPQTTVMRLVSPSSDRLLTCPVGCMHAQATDAELGAIGFQLIDFSADLVGDGSERSDVGCCGRRWRS